MHNDNRYIRFSDLTPAHMTIVPRLLADWTNRAGAAAFVVTGCLSASITPGTSYDALFNAASGILFTKAALGLYHGFLREGLSLSAEDSLYIDTAAPSSHHAHSLYLLGAAGFSATTAFAAYHTADGLIALDYQTFGMGVTLISSLTRQAYTTYKLGTGQWREASDPPPPPPRKDKRTCLIPAPAYAPK